MTKLLAAYGLWEAKERPLSFSGQISFSELKQLDSDAAHEFEEALGSSGLTGYERTTRKTNPRNWKFGMSDDPEREGDLYAFFDDEHVITHAIFDDVEGWDFECPECGSIGDDVPSFECNVCGREGEEQEVDEAKDRPGTEMVDAGWEQFKREFPKEASTFFAETDVHESEIDSWRFNVYSTEEWGGEDFVIETSSVDDPTFGSFRFYDGRWNYEEYDRSRCPNCGYHGSGTYPEECPDCNDYDEDDDLYEAKDRPRELRGVKHSDKRKTNTSIAMKKWWEERRGRVS